MRIKHNWRKDRSLRLAILIHHALQNRRFHRRYYQLQNLIDSMQSLKKQRTRLEIAAENQWHLAHRHLQQSVNWELTNAAEYLRLAQIEQQQNRHPPVVLSARQIHQELLALHNEFEAVQIQTRPWRIAVTTEPIELEQIHLGRFRVELQVPQLLTGHYDSEAFQIVALDPNPAASNEDVPHPHVRGELLCSGEATVPLGNALKEGRLLDAFVLIQRVLQTYNSHSAYVNLESWSGESCEDCGEEMDSDDAYTCERCQNRLCGDCMSSCASCDGCYCRRCLRRSNDDELLCERCRGVCRDCGAIALASELEEHDGRCHACHQTLTEAGAAAVTALVPTQSIGETS